MSFVSFLTFLPKGLDLGKKIEEKLGFFQRIKNLVFWGKVGGIVLIIVIAIIIGLLVYILIKKKNK